VTTTVVSIVEGDGEVLALPILLRRLCDWKTPGVYAEIPTPIRVRRDRFLNKDDEFNRHIQLASSKCQENGWILILLDADDDCPAELGKSILARAQKAAPHRKFSVVLANREYEAWLIAGATSLNGKRGVTLGIHDEGVRNAESIRNAKGWFSERMANGSYKEVLDQPALSASVDLDEAFEHSRSFRKLCCEWSRQVER
jgi:hypothetical protein